ncbi:MAG: hypothetical protein EPO32_05865 [Anaerolineae bacterium]|nr:MAG: hypothetical protein EPO32_05865 [Anaerolineae bacterium]
MAEIQFHYPSNDLLTVSWHGWFSDVRARLGETEIGKVYAFEELLKGTTFKCPDGSSLVLKYGLGGLFVERDGQPLPRTEAGHARALRPASWALYFVGAQSVFVGLLMIFFRGAVFGSTTYGPLIFIMGLLYIGLGVGVQRGKVMALYAGIGLYLLEAVVSIGLGIAGGQFLSLGTLGLRVLILGLMATGLEPLGALKEDE